MQEPQTRLYNQLLNTAFIRGVRKVIEVINGSTSQKVRIRAHSLSFTYSNLLIAQCRCSTRSKRTSSKSKSLFSQHDSANVRDSTTGNLAGDL